MPSRGALSKEDGIAIIEKAFKTWDDIKNTDLNLTEKSSASNDIGVVAHSKDTTNGSPLIFADIQIAGWENVDFGADVLGVTFTFVFVDNNGKFTDIDNNKKYDVSFREIYFNPSCIWTNNGTTDGIDVESIAVHEIGHGLSQAHFGTVYIKDGEMFVNPRAVMNAYYFGSYRTLQSTDLAGHYGIWAGWPNK